MRQKILDYVYKTYKTKPEVMWAKWPNYAVLRNSHNKKWYAIIMDVTGDKVGLDADKQIDIMNVTLDPEMVSLLNTQKGYRTAYHMNKKSWVTILLDGSVPYKSITTLVDTSYKIIDAK